MKIKMKSNFDEIYVGNSSYLSSLYINRAGNRIFRKNLNFTRKKMLLYSFNSMHMTKGFVVVVVVVVQAVDHSVEGR